MNIEERMYAEADKITVPETVVSSISSHIQKCFEAAETERQNVTDRMLACERQRKGEYEPDLAAQLKGLGIQPIYMMLTDIKCRAADAWIKDVMQNHQESTWALSPTVEPDLPPELVQEVASQVMQEAAIVAQTGIPVQPEAIEARKAEIADEAAEMATKIATDRAKKMEIRITDKLEEGNYRDALAQAIYDFTTFPCAFFKGPVLRKKPRMKWGENFTPIVEDAVVIEVERVSPYDMYPSPSAVSIQDGYLIHRQKLSRSALKSMIGMAGADEEKIKDVLTRFPNGYKTSRAGDATHEALQNRLVSNSPDGLLETLEYWGPASGFMLKEWGMEEVDGEKVDDFEEYQVNAWKVAGVVVRVVFNPHPLNLRPYSKASFVDIPGSFWGKALPEMMSDVQTMCNASARAMAMNMGIAAGPQVEVTVDRLAPGAKISNMTPFKLWQTTSDRTGGGQPAIRFSQADMHVSELLQIFQFFSKMSDEVTGIPNYLYGSSNVAGAGRTASGLSMLMENAAKGIKHAIMSMDRANSELINRIYLHLMLHDPDQSIKGDMQIVASGAIGAMIKEQKEQARNDFLLATNNPIDMQIIGPEGRAFMLREHAKTIFPDPDKVIPKPEMLAQRIALQQQQAAMAAQQGAPQGQQGPQTPQPQQQPMLQ